MPEIGEIKRGLEIGKGNNNKHIWQSCGNCGKERWVRLLRETPIDHLCCQCGKIKGGVYDRGEHSPRWKGGRVYNGGYVEVWVDENDFFYPMTGIKGYVLEHRLMIAKHLNRCLLPWEVVHHVNGIRDDNRLANLRLVKSPSDHLPSMHIKRQFDKQQREIETLKQRITLLEAELVLLKATQEVSV